MKSTLSLFFFSFLYTVIIYYKEEMSFVMQTCFFEAAENGATVKKSVKCNIIIIICE